jgi:periplasmic divalent cation tolerance protein
MPRAAPEMSDIALVRTTFGRVADAERIGRALVEARLAACVNVAPCSAIYRWTDGVERADEAEALFKTTVERAPALVAALTERHPYDLPAIESWPAAVSGPIGEWVRHSVS